MEDRTKCNIFSGIGFMDIFAIGLTAPLFANHVRQLGGSYFFIGLLSSIVSGIQLFSGPIVGSWSDLRGSKPLLMVTLLISSFCYIAIGLTSSLSVLCLVQVILGFTSHTQTLSTALIADTISKEQQSSVLARTTAISMSGFIIGPILGGHLSELHNGFFYVCLITSLIYLVNIALTNLLIPIEKKTQSGVKIQNELKKVLTDLTEVNWSSYWSLFASKFFHAQAFSVYFYNYSIILRDNYGISQKIIGYTISFQSCIGTISGFLTGWINKTFYKNDDTHSQKYFYGFIIMTISFIILSSATQFNYFLIGLIPLAIANSFLSITETDILLTKSVNDKGSLVGTSNSLSSLAQLAAPICSGIVSDIWGQNSVLYMTVILALLGTILTGVLYFREKQKVV